MAGDTRTLRVVVTGDSSSAQTSMRKLRGEVSTTDKQLSGMSGALSTWAKRGAIAVGVAAGAAAKVGLTTASQMQQSRIAFTNMLGDGQKAEAFLQQLAKFAAKTPFEFPELVSSTQKLMAMGFQAKDVIPTLTAVGDAVAGMGGSGESIQFVTRALGQMQAKGKVSGEELRQLAEQGIPAIKYLADAFGVTTGEMFKLVEKGVVPADKGIKIITAGMEKGSKSARGFGGMMAQQATTIQGRWSTLKDEIKMMLGQLAEKAFPLLGKAMESVTNGLKDFIAGVRDGKGPVDGITGPMNTLGLGIRALVLAFKDGDVTSDGFVGAMERLGVVLRAVWEKAKVFGNFLKEHQGTVKTFAAVLLTLVTVYKIATGVIRIFGIVMALVHSPIVLIVAGLAVLITVLVRAYKTNETFRKIVQAVWKAVSSVISVAWNNVIKPIWGAMKIYLGVLGTVYSTLWKVISKVFGWIGSKIKGIWNDHVKPAFNAMKTAVGKVGDAFGTAKRAIGTAWDAIKGIAAKPIAFVINTVLRGGLQKGFNKIAELVGLKTRINIPEFRYATGGVLPGYTPGRDVHKFYNPALGFLNLSGGEAIMRPEFTRMVGGPSGVAALNRMSRGYADGGVLGWLKGGVSKAWEMASNPMDAFKGLANKVTDRFGNSIIAKAGKASVEKLIGGAVGTLKDAFGKLSSGFAHDKGSGTGGNVQRWSGLVLRVLTELRQSPMLLAGVLRRIQMESGGNPNAINLWDSNAAMGIPSQGLMQTIPSTFAAYAGPYRALGITNPLASIYAGLNYALHRYGSIGAIDPRVRPMGYDSGGYLPPGLTLAYNGTGKPEPVGHDLKGTHITVNVTVEGNVTTERDLVKAITLGVRDELIRHAGRNGGRTGLPPR